MLLASSCALGYHVVLVFMPSQACNVTYIILEIWSKLLLYWGNMISPVCEYAWRLVFLHQRRQFACLVWLQGLGWLRFSYYSTSGQQSFYNSLCVSWFGIELSIQSGRNMFKKDMKWTFLLPAVKVLQLTAGVSDLLSRGFSLRTAQWFLFMISSRVRKQRKVFNRRLNDVHHKQYIQ